MKKLIPGLCLLLLANTAWAQNKSFEEKAKAYVKQYGAWAIEEQQRVGIPASITLAQGIYETGAGESELATKANNHFGIKCKKEWKGATFAHTDDAPNECFRKYNSAKESYVDHSNYLKNSVRYAELFTYDKADYTSWAKGLRRCGYATNPAYAQKLIKMVEDFDLQVYTFAADGKKTEEVVPGQETLLSVKTEAIGSTADGTEKMNGIKGVYAKKGDNLLDKAMKYNIRYARLLEINELADEPLKKDMFIYLEPKNNKGAHPIYVVKEGETIESIAHAEGMNSRQLRIFNLLAQNEQAAIGSVLQLQVQSDTRPETYRMVKDAVIAPASNVRLVDPNAGPSKNEYLPTKKSVQKVEELEFGYGAERPAELTPAPAPVQKQVIQSAKPAEQLQTAPQKLTQVPVMRETVKQAGPIQAAKPIIKEAKNESENAETGGLPETLDGSNGDDLAALKEKLDRAVYSRSSKSNIKVSSEDESSLFSSGAPATTTPAPAASAPATAKSKETADPNAQYYIVQKGDTGYSIAKKYGIKVKDLNDMNNLNFEGIKVGQKLRVK